MYCVLSHLKLCSLILEKHALISAMPSSTSGGLYAIPGYLGELRSLTTAIDATVRPAALVKPYMRIHKHLSLMEQVYRFSR